MVYEDVKDMSIHNIQSPKYDRYQCGLASVGAIKSEIMFSEKISKTITQYVSQLLENLKKNKRYNYLLKTLFRVMLWIECSKEFRFLLCLIDFLVKTHWFFL